MSLSAHIQLTAAGPHFSRTVAGVMNLASWGLNPQQRLAWVEQCLELGITTFDHADIYGGYTCEGLFGEALALKPSLRPHLQLVSKCGIKLISPNRPGHWVHSYDTSFEHIVWSAENSLKQLQTDYLDLLLIHRPSPLMDIDQVAKAFDHLHQSGKVRFFGVSNFAPSQLSLLASAVSQPLVTNQVELSVINMNTLHDGTIDQCYERRIRPMIWSPVGGGWWMKGETEQSRRLLSVLGQLGHELGGKPIDQVALAWLLAHPAGLLPVLGTGKVERLKLAVEAEQIALTQDQWFAIWQASAGHEVP